jgi:hypothetical protein
MIVSACPACHCPPQKKRHPVDSCGGARFFLGEYIPVEVHIRQMVGI